MLNHGELREVVDNIEDKKDRRNINFTTKYSAAQIYGKIGQTKCQLVIDTEAEVSVCTKSITNLLKLKPKVNKIMTVIAINKVKQKSLRSAEIMMVKIID